MLTKCDIVFAPNSWEDFEVSQDNPGVDKGIRKLVILPFMTSETSLRIFILDLFSCDENESDRSGSNHSHQS